MPPQQSHGLLDRLDERFGFGAHDVSVLENKQLLGCDRSQIDSELTCRCKPLEHPAFKWNHLKADKML